MHILILLVLIPEKNIFNYLLNFQPSSLYVSWYSKSAGQQEERSNMHGRHLMTEVYSYMQTARGKRVPQKACKGHRQKIVSVQLLLMIGSLAIETLKKLHDGTPATVCCVQSLCRLQDFVVPWQRICRPDKKVH